MTDKAIQLMEQDSEVAVQNMTRQVMKLASGNQRLNAEQAVQLAVASRLTGLNPFNQEIYMTNRGVMIGVAGVRRKASEQLIYESGETSNHFYPDFRPALADEGDFDPDKDVAYICTITDDVSTKKWRVSLHEFIKVLKDAGMDGSQAFCKAVDVVGRKPSWSAVGVVRASESFGANGKDAWDRHERAKKRAEKWALRKRFPSVIVDYETYETYGGSMDAGKLIRNVTEQVHQEQEATQEKQTEREIMRDLGFEDVPVEPSDVSQETDVIEGEFSEKQLSKAVAPHWEAEALAQVVEREFAKNVHHAANLLAQSDFLMPTQDVGTILNWAMWRHEAKSNGDEDPTSHADSKLADIVNM